MEHNQNMPLKRSERLREFSLIFLLLTFGSTIVSRAAEPQAPYRGPYVIRASHEGLVVNRLSNSKNPGTLHYGQTEAGTGLGGGPPALCVPR